MKPMPDKIQISGLDCIVAIGVTPEERARKQRLVLDIEFEIDARPAAVSDSIRDAIDYGTVAIAVSEVCQSRSFHLIETVAELVAARVLADFPTPHVRVRVRKIAPVVNPPVAFTSIEITRP
jgi:dihydroneopterin aldolase